MVTQKTIAEIELFLEQVGLVGHISVDRSTHDQCIVFRYQTRAYIEGNWKWNVAEAMSDLVQFVQNNLDEVQEAIS